MPNTSIIMAMNNVVDKFDPELHRGNVYDAFKEFIESFQYEYDAIAKDLPTGDAPTQAAWVEQNKRKIFLGRFASRNLQKDYEDAVTDGERSNITFTEMVSKLQARCRPTRNHTLANYEFHRLCQNTNESFDVFVNRIKHEAKSCQFKCSNDTCCVPSIMIRDQIVIGTINAEIRNNVLKNQWELDNLVKKWQAVRSCHTQCSTNLR